MTRPPFPSVIDSSLMSHFRACPRQAELESFQHWKHKSKSVHLHAGASFARGLEVARLAFYQDGHDEQTAISLGLNALLVAYGDFECPPDSPKSLQRMCGALEFYFSQYPMRTDSMQPSHLPGGRLGIEFSFAEPIDLEHPETGDPLLYCGRFDMIGEYAGQIFGEDDKTASQLGPSWAKQWDMRSQFTAYTWGARKAGIDMTGFLVRGVSILKTDKRPYDTQQAITYRPQWQLDRWYEQTVKDVQRMIQMWESGAFDYNLDESCNGYGGCQFRKICLAEPHRQINWLHTDFERRRWDPVTRVETRLPLDWPAVKARLGKGDDSGGVPAGYTADELDADNPYNAWTKDVEL